MELLRKPDAAMQLGVTVDVVEAMIADGTLFAVRFASGIRVLLDDVNELATNDRDSPKFHPPSSRAESVPAPVNRERADNPSTEK